MPETAYQALHPVGLFHHGGEASGGDHDEADKDIMRTPG